MNNLKFGQVNIPTGGLTATYHTIDWSSLSSVCKLVMYSTFPGTNEPIDKPTVTHSPQIEPSRNRTFDEVMEQVLEDRAEAWERLADL